jgi:shikimate dehydrogenase
MRTVAPVACILGNPLGHSLSPRLHGHWLRHYNLAGHYVPLQVPTEAALFDIMQAWRASDNIVGGNVTVPYKKAIVPLLDALTPLAQRCGAVNTIIRQSNGQWLGHNTDGLGLVADMQSAGHVLQGKNILILGAGGAAAGIMPALYDTGARLSLYNRTTATAHEVAGQMAQVFIPQHAPAPTFDIIINTITQSAAAIEFLPWLHTGALVYDINYGQTNLLAAAAALGHPVRDGLGMLLHQAVEGFSAWFGHTPQVTAREEQLLRNC